MKLSLFNSIYGSSINIDSVYYSSKAPKVIK